MSSCGGGGACCGAYGGVRQSGSDQLVLGHPYLRGGLVLVQTS